MTLKSTLLVIGILIILSLAAVAAYYLYALRKQEADEKIAKLQKDIEREAQISKVKKSIELLVQFVEQEQLEHAEAAIRISGLLHSIGYTRERYPAFVPFYELSEAIAHMPILDKWKALDRTTKKAYTVEREALENQYAPAITKALAAVRSHPDFFTLTH